MTTPLNWQDAWEKHRVTLGGYSTEDTWLFQAAFELGQASLISWAAERLKEESLHAR